MSNPIKFEIRYEYTETRMTIIEASNREEALNLLDKRMAQGDLNASKYTLDDSTYKITSFTMQVVPGCPVGFLVVVGTEDNPGSRFVCHICVGQYADVGPQTPTPVYEDNIRPYSQGCGECGMLVIDGARKSIDNTPLCVFDTGVFKFV